MTNTKKGTRLSLTGLSTDEALRSLIIRHLRSLEKTASYDAEETYDMVVAVHEARRAIRRQNTRKTRRLRHG